jgi:hypothetical protein
MDGEWCVTENPVDKAETVAFMDVWVLVVHAEILGSVRRRLRRITG